MDYKLKTLFEYFRTNVVHDTVWDNDVYSKKKNHACIYDIMFILTHDNCVVIQILHCLFIIIIFITGQTGRFWDAKIHDIMSWCSARRTYSPAGVDIASGIDIKIFGL